MSFRIFWLILFLTILRILIAPFPGLGVDEAHYYLYGKYLSWSYFDHPPLVGWTHFLFSWLSANELTVRLPAILLGALTSYFSYCFLRKIGTKEVPALWAVVALNFSFMPNFLFLMLLPDSLHMALLIPLMLAVKRVEERGTWLDYFFAAVLLGISGLAKYTAVLFILSIIIYLLWQKKYLKLLTLKILIVAAVGLVFVFPVLYWNYNNDFISFTYQNDHVLEASGYSLLNALKSLGLQFFAYSPFLFIIAFWGVLRTIQKRNESDYYKLALSFGGISFLFFLYSSLKNIALPHWPILFYQLFIPLGVCFLLEEGARLKKWITYFSIFFSASFILILYLEVVTHIFPFKDYQSLYQDIYGWPQMMRQAQILLEQDSNTNRPRAIGMTNWTLGSRARFYNHDRSEVYILDKRSDQFDLWEKKIPLGYDILLINTHFFHVDLKERFLCDKFIPADRLDIKINDYITDTIDYVWCRNYQGLNDQ